MKDIQDLSQPAVDDISSISNKTVPKSKSIKSKNESTSNSKSKRLLDLGNNTNSPGCSTSGVITTNICNGEMNDANMASGFSGVKGRLVL